MEVRASTARAATWRDPQNEIVGTTYGGTMCHDPVGPNTLRVYRNDFAIVARCRKCPGCMEFDQRELMTRLYLKYKSPAGVTAVRSAKLSAHRAQAAEPEGLKLFLVRIWVPLSQQAALSHRLHRITRFELEPGFWRLGTGSIGILARSVSQLHPFLRRRGLEHRIESLKLGRGRRAFRSLTAGVMVSRDVYGEQVNRWYCRGLPKLEKLRWEVNTREGSRGYSKRSSPRAWASGRLVLVPPEVWRLPRASRRDLRNLLARAASPEDAARVMELAGQLGSARSLQSSSSSPAEGRLTREQVKDWYAQMAARKAKTSTADSASGYIPSLSEARGYVSSEHSSGAPPPDPSRSDYERQLELDGRTRREKVARLKEQPWESLTADERALIHESIREDERKMPAAARAKLEREKSELLERLESLRKKISGGG